MGDFRGLFLVVLYQLLYCSFSLEMLSASWNTASLPYILDLCFFSKSIFWGFILSIYESYSFGSLSFLSIAFWTVLSKTSSTTAGLFWRVWFSAARTTSSSAANSHGALFPVPSFAVERTSFSAFSSRLTRHSLLQACAWSYSEGGLRFLCW